ncbi:MAG: hypothetical protein QOD91_548, partial [Frankiales bacterium]|nr:hypothetical protein [Frankiales bacterium]
MSLRTTLRGFRATTTFVVTAAVAFSPAVAQAATKKHAPAKTPRSALKEAHGKAPAKSTVKLVGKSQTPATPALATAANGLGNKMGLAPAMQLTAMRTAIAASPAVWVGHETGCNIVTPMLTSQSGLIMAGNFRDADANCYVWMNMEQ